MTSEELLFIVRSYWEVNKKNAQSIAEATIKRHSLPPVVSVLPGVPEFLGDLQKSSFFWGAAAVLHQMETQLLEIKKLCAELETKELEKVPVDPKAIQ